MNIFRFIFYLFVFAFTKNVIAYSSQLQNSQLFDLIPAMEWNMSAIMAGEGENRQAAALTWNTYNIPTVSAVNADDKQKFLPKVITTLPRTGTSLLWGLMRELEMNVAVQHFMLDDNSEIARLVRSDGDPHGLLRKPEHFVDKTVVVIRDLHDIMPSMLYWIEQLVEKSLQNGTIDNETLQTFTQFLNESYETRLLQIINASPGPGRSSMQCIISSCQLVLDLLNKKGTSNASIFVMNFEDYIGTEFGGRQTDPERFKLLSDMCGFLGYERSPYEVEIAFKNIVGKTGSYNPVKKKIGRWEDVYNEEHIEAFDKIWGDLNIQLQDAASHVELRTVYRK
jgi:hypothetical protein